MSTVEHVIGIFSPEHGGPVVSLTNYALGQAAAGWKVRVRTLEGYPNVSPAVRLPESVDQQVFPVGWPALAGRSRPLARALRRESSPDVYHLHGAWLRALSYGFGEAGRRRRPYLVEVNGTFQPYELARKPWRKRLFRRWFQDRIFREASCLHVNSRKEAREMRSLGFRAPIAVIPAGFDFAARSAAAGRGPASGPWPELEGRPFILYLARLHPNKGVELLLEAWRHVQAAHPDVVLLLVGTGEPGYVARLHRLADDAGLADRCVWKGFVSEDEKSWAFAHARFYCLPSFTENFGNTVQEALGHGTPVLTTDATPWLELPALGCGWIAACTAAAIGEQLAVALSLPGDRLRAMGRAGEAHVAREFSLSSVVQKQIATYNWLLGGPAPEDLLFP